jgi:DNA invertase Pin-like site-specific DNA recombinase
MTGVFADFKHAMIQERAARTKDECKALRQPRRPSVPLWRRAVCIRSPLADTARVRELKGQGMRPTDIAKALGIGRASVYRAMYGVIG